jgi:alkanesulfonate monooxygenase SsuD/methylene tetrahydromethanopterin reductase-like flavin-dependent oxidoreductase (luciferase family)
MQLGLSVVLLALLNPVQVAEDVATLDVISEGRVVFGIGLGYRGIEYERSACRWPTASRGCWRRWISSSGCGSRRR